MIADILTGFGLLLTVIGAWRAAASVVLKEDDAIAIGVSRYASEVREENLKIPAVQNLLKASKGARQGFCLIAIGTFFQILPIALKLLAVSPAMAANTTETHTLYRTSLTDPIMRVHIASFDSDSGSRYNAENCAVAADLFQRQDGVESRFWCEPGRFQK